MALTAATGAALLFASGGITALGQIQEGQQRAETEEYNANLSRQQAEIVKARGKLDVFRQKKSAKSFTSTQQAIYSKAGVALSGSPLSVIEESAANAELDILLTEFNTYSQASRLESEATESEYAAKMQRISGYKRAGTTLLTSAAQYGMR